MSIGTVVRAALGSLLDLARRAWRALRPLAHRLIRPLAEAALSLLSGLRRRPRPDASTTASTAPSSPGARTVTSTAIRSSLAAAPTPTGEAAPLALRWQRLARRVAHMAPAAPA